MAASALSWTPVVYRRLTTGCLTRASCLPVTSLCVCVCLSLSLANVTPCSYLVSVSSAAIPSPALFYYSVTLLYILTPDPPRRPPSGHPAWLLILVHIFNKASRM